MLVVVPVSRHDRDLIEDFCNVVCFFGPYKAHNLIVVSRPSDKQYAKVVHEKLRESFQRTEIHSFDQNGSTGWPQGPNFYWHQTIAYLKTINNKQPWLWMEMDVTPVEEHWLDLLEKEYNDSKTKLLGCIQVLNSAGFETTHVNGVAVYPPRVDKEFLSWTNVLKKEASAFDMECAKEFVFNTTDSRLMQNCFRTELYRCTNDGLKGLDRTERCNGQTFDQIIKKDVVLVHGCIDGSLARLITSKEAAPTIPIFYHIPKSAGSYVRQLLIRGMRYYNLLYANVKFLAILRVRHEGLIVCTLYALDPNLVYSKSLNFSKKKTENTKANEIITTYEVDLNNLTEENLKDVFVFTLTISSNGFKLRQKILKKLNRFNQYEFIVIRNPFDRLQSLYYYLNSSNSAHESTHNFSSTLSFQEAIASEQIEDNWLVRNLCVIPDDSTISEKDYKQAYKYLDHMNVYKIQNVKDAVNDAFNKCYYFNLKSVEQTFAEDLFKNETAYEKININQLNSVEKSIIEKKIFWENKLWNELFFNK